MRKTYISKIQSNIDFNVVQYGREDCRKNYTVANFVRRNYLIHYVLRGCGTFMMQGKSYAISQNSAFIIVPGVTTVYSSDSTDPWEYAWVEFNGSKAGLFLEMSNLCADNPVILDAPPYKMRDAAISLTEGEITDHYELTARLWHFLGTMCSDDIVRRPTISEKAKEYIDANFARALTVGEVAKFVGVDRSYLSRVFSDVEGISPKCYMTRLRMHAAAAALRDTTLPVGTIAMEVGFGDAMNFSNAFKAFYGVSPSVWRRKGI